MQNPDIAIGIDLGTTYSAVTIQKPGKVERMLFPGVGPQLPSAVLWSLDGQHLVGQAALNAAFKHPDRLFTHFKRGLPTAPDAPWNGGPTPVELTTQMLHEIWSVLRQTHAEISEFVPELNGRKPPQGLRIILTHPATYRQDQVRTLQRIVDAVGDGFRVNGFITEPTAAALVYRQQGSLNQNDLLAVFDIGGGTTDTCVLQFVRGRFEPVISAKGNPSLGGLNFTGPVYQHFCSLLGYSLPCFDDQRGLTLSAGGLSNADRRLASKIWTAAEETKILLSTADPATVYIETPDGLKELVMDRKTFVDLCRDAGDQWARLEACVADLLAGSSLQWPQIHSIALVGGSAMLPTLRERVAAITRREPDRIFRSSDSTHVVADGAAYQAFVQDDTAHCLPGGLGVRLRKSTQNDPGYYYKFFFNTREIIPAGGTNVQQLGQMIDSPGGRCWLSVVLGEAKPGLDVAAGALVEEGEVVPLKTIATALDLPRGKHDVEFGFQFDPASRLHWRLRLPDRPDIDVQSGLVTDLAPPTPDIPRDLVILLDVSSSMRGDKFRAAQNATHNLLAQVSLLDIRVALIEFGRHVRLAGELGSPLETIGAAVETLVANGQTPLAAAIDLGSDHLKSQGTDQRERLLLLVTDGHPDDVPATERAAQQAKSHATLLCLGIGHDVSQQLLLAMATTTQHCFFADSAGAIESIFTQIVELYLKS